MIVGILGGIGSGKSTVTRMFVDLGAKAVDADRMAHEVLETVRHELVAWLGDAVVSPDGAIDRRAVARRVFGRSADLRRLEDLVHPGVLRKIADEIRTHRDVGSRDVGSRDVGSRDVGSRDVGQGDRADSEAMLVLDVPLLLETPLRHECQALVFVDAPLDVRRRRAAERGWDPAEVEVREKFQTSTDEKRRLSDFVIDNGGSLDETRRQVADCVSRIRGLVRGERA